MKLDFLGAAGTVTGSKTLVTHEGKQLLVDCGLFQGYKNLRAMNWEPFPFDPTKLDAVVLTHAHLDHAGALPLLVKRGFRGPVFATPSTIDVCRVLLPDSARIQEEDAEYANRHKLSKHQPALPLYSEEDAQRALRRLEPLPLEQREEVMGGMQLRLRQAGHILGASSVELTAGGTTVLFSGDLGRPDDLIMRAPLPIARADHVVIESTYGDRLHDTQDVEAAFGEVIKRTAARGGIVVVPAFAVGRAQALLYAIYRLKTRAAIPDLPVFLNSPMAIDMTEIYHRHRAEHRLSVEECRGMCQVAKMTRTVEESRALNTLRYPAVIVSASGMATGGRVLHHLKALGPDRRNTIVFAGYQADGTRGARLLAGERSIRIHGEDVTINAEVMSLPGMSAHADAEQLVQWLATAPQPPRGIYLNHGEPGPADALRQRIERELGWPATVPRLGQSVEVA
ncbi:MULTISPECIES: MBL fold metallo-hydrolase [unclassified Variovorax]|uniref:MBL fold metallo-hydrolase n=1 Tax=unclassified Variovorax TaxID=663243 RepID=UPI00076CA2A2|nr:MULTISPECIES: MBL fold metallo-hydrolase [unclassified Variovorax]KWT91599.1 Metallo-beta-lactamase family protein, RNA-specific [Variovorax sp. WDL1]PNG48980.1 Ribonuclease [Variovorax sp. B4]PNG49742.1 Ribonuclease [Variovorax sp. B2]VTV18553.1 Ribonuclease [Variovorax sp. WDL1]